MNESALQFSAFFAIAFALGALACALMIRSFRADEVADLSLKLQTTQKYLEGRREVIATLHHRLGNIERDHNDWTACRDGYPLLINRFKQKARDQVAGASSSPSPREVAVSVGESLRALRQNQRTLSLEHELAPRVSEVKQPPEVSQWRTISAPMDPRDTKCPPWEFLHLPTGSRLEVHHDQRAEFAHWLFVAKVVPPIYVDDDGTIDSSLFARNFQEMRQVVSYEYISQFDFSGAIDWAKIWLQRWLEGEPVGLLRPNRRIVLPESF